MTEQEIFEAALECEKQLRDQFMEQACGDDLRLRERVEKLLQLHDEPGEYFEKPAGEIVGMAAPLSETTALGDMIGPYKLREQIAEGGMGVVYVAEQTEPVRRKVALKVVKPGLGTQQVLGRFEAERQALALMNHANIARIFDAGSTESGQPFFVMELVQGPPITEFCDQNQLTTRERLKLFLQVCDGVKHAHQKGIIHRDIKPSNVLVPRIDDAPVPKVIDFGVAKAIGEKLTEETVYTQFSQMIGTPLYMSPEQADFGVVDVDTRSDIYSLGVLLYELLTGGTPFDRETLKRLGFDEFRKIIREQDPPRPSSAVSTLDAQKASTIAGQRRADPRLLCDALRGELDWVVMKALEKDRGRRYETVGALAADVQRHLDGAPVEACPPSIGYRLKKAISQHRTLVLVATTVLMALSLGAGIASWQAIHARQVAEQEKAARQQAQANLTLAINAVADMYEGLAMAWLASDQALTQVQANYSQKAVDFYCRLLDHPQQYELSDHQAAEMAWRAAQLLRKMGQDEDASRRLMVATQRFASALNGREASASNASLELLIDMQNLLGVFAEARGDWNTAKQAFSDANAACEQLAQRPAAKDAAHLRQAFVANNLYSLYDHQGDVDLAEREIRRALEIFEGLDPKMLVQAGVAFQGFGFRGNLSALLLRQGKQREAEELASQALLDTRRKLVSTPDDRRVREAETYLMWQLARCLVYQGKMQLAEPLLEELIQRQISQMSIGVEPALYTYAQFMGQPDRFPGFEEPEKWSNWIRTSLMLAEVKHSLEQPVAAEILLGRAAIVGVWLRSLFPNRARYLVDDANLLATTAWVLKSRYPDQANWYAIGAAKAWQATLAKFPSRETKLSELHPDQSDFEWFVEQFPECDFRRRELDERPTSKGWIDGRARALIALDFGQQPDKQLTRLVENQATPEPFDLFTLALTLAQAGRLEESRTRYQEAVDAFPQNTAPEPVVVARQKEVEALLAAKVQTPSTTAKERK